MKQEPNKFATYLAMIAAPFAIGAFFLTWAPSAQFANEDPAGDGYVPPRSIERLVDRTQESTVTVWCDPTKGKGTQGTAWAIELETDVSKEYPTTLITNHRTFCQSPPLHSTHDYKTTPAFHQATGLPFMPADWHFPRDHLRNTNS